MIRISVLVILMSFLAFGSAKAGGSSNPTKPNVAAHASDSQIEAIIRTKLAKSKIGKDGFRFTVSHGTVTWQGNTAVPQHKGAATRMAHSSGATQVVNNIQVSSGAKPGVPLKKALVQ